MLQYFLSICLCLLLAGPEAHAAEGTRLLNLGKGEGQEETVLRLEFSKRPRYRLGVSGQRIDLFLYDTSIGPLFAAAPQQGGSVEKITLVEKVTGLLVCFHMSGIPQGARVEVSGGGNDLTVHVFWLPINGKVPPTVASRRVGGTGEGGNSTGTRAAATSRYAPDWERFYREFQTPVVWKLPVSYTFPEIPAPENGVSPGLREIWRRSLNGDWDEAGVMLQRLEGEILCAPDRQFFLLLSGGVLLRELKYGQAREMYQQFRQAYPASPYLNRYMVMAACARAWSGDPYGAVSEISGLLPKAGVPGKRGEATAELLYAEVQLAIGRPLKALEVLTTLADTGEGRFSRVVQLRTAAARAAGLGQYRQALLGYQKWLLQAVKAKESMDLYSLAQWAEALEAKGDLRAAEQAFTRLASTSKVPEEQALALFAAARAGRKLIEDTSLQDRCGVIIKQYPGSEGAMRARLLELDLIMGGTDKAQMQMRSGEYATIAAQAHERVLREEAAFKNALAVVLYGNKLAGVELLRTFRRDFASGPLRGEAEVLLLHTLEPLLTELWQAGKSYEAMVLVEKNRDLLTSFTLSPGFAGMVGQVFKGMGMYKRAVSIYDYLVRHAENKTDEEQYYLPLIEALYADGRNDELIDTVQRYRERFPTGKSLTAILIIEGRLYLELGRLDEADTLLSLIRDESPEVMALRGRLAVAAAIHAGESDGPSGGENSGAEQPAAQLMRAERLLREGQVDEALALFEKLIAAGAFVDQARYRCGEIYLDLGERKRGINFLRDLVEKGTEPYWQGLAREMLALASVG